MLKLRMSTVLGGERMSHQICHPTGIPIQCRYSRTSTVTPAALQDISEEELCFVSPDPFDLCARVTLTLETLTPPFEGDAWVIGCRPQGDLYEVRVRLLERSQVFELRMAEQLCHIALYQRVRAETSSDSPNQDAVALEWIDRHAETF